MRIPYGCVGCEEEKVSCETFKSPSMMWKRSIVQARAGAARAALALALLASTFGAGGCADLVIEIPGSGVEGQYRLDYRPPQGSPAPNFTVPARASTINFQGLPGTKYHFMLYYSNATFADLLTWNQTIITAPEPPTNLTVALARNKQATIAWAPPAHGDYTGFRFKVIPLTERAEGGGRNITVEAPAPAAGWTHALRDLSPGATYQLHAFTLLHDKESAAYASRNFTTKPNTPGKFIVWFRNETTLLVLWQPPYPPGAYTHYKVSIVPPDARESELYVEKEGEPPGPAQAAFKGLVPGRAYNISVQTVSEPEISAPTTAQYRTVPLRPRDVQLPPADRTATSFRVTWLPPKEESEFEKYQVSVSGGGARRPAPVLRARDDAPSAVFEGLEPGAHYQVAVKTMSGKVTSWPAPAEVTLKPLPVRDLQWKYQDESEGGGILVWWLPAEGSTQDEYKVSYHEAGGGGSEDSSALTTAATNVTLDAGGGAALLPGRNYTVAVTALSRGVESDAAEFSAGTRPLAPVVRSWGGGARALRLAWRSDVNSRQDRYELRYRRRAAPPEPDAPFRTLTTADTNATLEGLFPGAVYEVQVAALSHGLRSEFHTVLKPVRPLPAEWMGVERATSNSVVVRWRGPSGASRLGAFLLQYRTHAERKWTRLPPVAPNVTEAEIVDMTHGERYTIQLDTLSEAAAGGDSVDSGEPREADHTVRPNPVSNVAALVDTRNMTLEWPRPAGRVERYELRWRPAPGEGEGAAGARNLSADDAARTARALLGALEPGVAYRVAITAHSYNLSSDLFTMDTRTRPLILSEMTIVNEPETDDDGNVTAPAILVGYTLTPAAATRFDSYRFRLEGGGGEGAREETRPAAAPPRRLLFAALAPGRLYNITMWTVSRNVTSHPVQRQTRLYPRPVAWLNATDVQARSVALAWPAPPGDYTDFELQYLAAADTLEARTTAARQLTVRDLQPYTSYTFTLEVRSGTPATILTRSAGLSTTLRTRQAPPPAPRAFQPTDAAPRRLTFAWDLPPEDANGVLQRFVIEYAPQSRPENNSTVTFPPEARSGAVAGLTPGETYTFRLWAVTGAGAGAAASWTQHLAIAAPPRPPPSAAPAAVRATPTTVAVRFRADYFSSANGNLTAYALVVAQEPRNESLARLPSWRDVQRLPVWPPYQVTEPYFPFHNSMVEEFTIGSERCEGGGRTYCNGPLRPGAAYYVKLRAYTAPDKFTDTAYTLVYTGGQHGVDHRRVRGRGGAGGGGRGVGGAAPASPARRARARAARAARLAPRARGRLPRPLPPHVRRLRLQVQRGVRGAEERGARAAVHGGRPARQPAQEPLHQHPAVRPQPLQAAARGRRGGLRLHQRQLRARPQLAARVHCHAGPPALDARRLLAHGVGVGLARHRDADALRGEGPREVRPLLAVRHAARVLRRHLGDGAQREPLPRLDGDGAAGGARRGAARGPALPLHHVARLRRARPAHHAGQVRARVPRALPGRRAARGGALQRGRGPLGHVHRAGPRAAAAGRAAARARRVRDGARAAARARVDGADGAAVHLHPPVRRGRAGRRRPGAAAAPHAPQPGLRRRRGHRGVRHVTRADGTLYIALAR